MWNYRVVRRKHVWQDPQSQKERITYSYGIHEAYYDHDGHVGMITQDAIEPYGETIEELRHVWVMMAEAFGQPLLDYENIPEPGYDGDHERLACEAETERIEEDEDDNDVWKPMTAEERAEYHATQEEERIHEEQRHQQEFIGTHPLKRLIDSMYKDYAAWHERNRGDEQDT
jgi:hypothetical protein